MFKQAKGDIGNPTTIRSALVRGYLYLNEAKCKACQAEIDWWETPRGKRIPIDVDHQGTSFVAHWTTCPNAQDFRKG